MLSTLSCIPVWTPELTHDCLSSKCRLLSNISSLKIQVAMTSSIVVASKKLDCDEEQTLTYLLTIWRLAFLHRRSPHRQASVTSSLSAWVSPSKRRPTDVVFGGEKKRVSWHCLSKASRADRLRTKANRWKDWTKTWRKPRTPIRLLRNGYDSDHDVTCIRAIALIVASLNCAMHSTQCDAARFRMSVNTKMEHRTLAWVLVITPTRVHLSESVSRKDSERKMF